MVPARRRLSCPYDSRRCSVHSEGEDAAEEEEVVEVEEVEEGVMCKVAGAPLACTTPRRRRWCGVQEVVCSR